MANYGTITVLFTFLLTSTLTLLDHHASAKVFMVQMDDDTVISYKNHQKYPRSAYDVKMYKEKVTTGHDIFLESLLPVGSYTKLYSYTHLLNGFAVQTTSEVALKILDQARAIRSIQEDVKVAKQTTHTPEYLGVSGGVWPELGGAEGAGEGVVIGIIDTGINPHHPSFYHTTREESAGGGTTTKFKGRCEYGDGFPPTACNGKIVGARYFARGAMAAGEFNATRDFASPFDPDGHGSHTAATAAGNYGVPVIVDGFSYGNASGMAPGARIAVYKALFEFGGFMSDVVAAIDQAVEDGVDIVSLSMGATSIPAGAAAFLNVLDVELLLAVRAGVVVVQAVGNGGPFSSSVLSFSPWILSVAASTTDRRYNNSVVLGNADSFSGTGLSPPTAGEELFPVAAATDVCAKNGSSESAGNCLSTSAFVPSLVRGKVVICTYASDLDSDMDVGAIKNAADVMSTVGAAGFIFAMDPDSSYGDFTGAAVNLPVPGIVITSFHESQAIWDYYNAHTVRDSNGDVVSFGATARIMDGRHATYTRQAPVVASYSSRGPDVNNVELQTADVLKPNVMAPGSSVWAAWSPASQSEDYLRGQNFALVSGTSMATPHVSGIAALIKHSHPDWSPAAIASALMTTARVSDHAGSPFLAQQGSGHLSPANPFDLGAGAVDPARALDPGLVFDAGFEDYVRFLCAVPGVDDDSVRRAVGPPGCPAVAGAGNDTWCSDLNTASVTVSSLVGTREVRRRVTSVGGEKETYRAVVMEPAGVGVGVAPRAFAVSPKGSRELRITLRAREALDAFTFGELRLEGSRGHLVRVPLAVYVSSTLRS